MGAERESGDGSSDGQLNEPLMSADDEQLLLSVQSHHDHEDGDTSADLIMAAATESTKPASVTSLLLSSIMVACCGCFASGCASGYTSPVESEMESELELTTSEFSWFASLLTIGALVGSLPSGKVTDWLGRRGAMGVSGVFCLVGWLVIAMSQGIWSLYLGRLLVGYATGSFSYVVPIYLAEIAPKNIRGGSVLASVLAISSGTSLIYCVGLIMSWRFLALIGAFPCLIQIIGLIFIPESPRWLLKTKQDDEFRKTLQKLRGCNVDIYQEAAEIEELNAFLQGISDVNILSLFQKKYAFALTVVLGLKFLSSCSGEVGLMFYASYIFESAGLSSTIGSITLAVIQVLSTILSLNFMDKVGRRPLLMLSALGMCFGCILSGLSFLLEMFPMNAKGLAGSLATTVNWSMAWLVSYAFNFMVEWSSYGTFFVFACVNGCSLFFVAKMVPETKNQSLEEIQESSTT